LIASHLTRLAAIRRRLKRLVERWRRWRVGQSIADGYLRQPQTEAEVGWPDEATKRMIADEPW
jgi:hypothetical protein